MPELSEDMQAIHTRACHNVKRRSAKNCEVGKAGEQMKQRTKYNSKKCEFGGHVFDSKDEMLYYQYMIGMNRHIRIELQPKFELIPDYVYQSKKHRGIFYTADFKVFDETGTMVIIDIKGMETQQGNIRRKLFQYRYPDIQLLWISRNIKHGTDGWIEYDELKKIRAKNKKEKQ